MAIVNAVFLDIADVMHDWCFGKQSNIEHFHVETGVMTKWIIYSDYNFPDFHFVLDIQRALNDFQSPCKHVIEEKTKRWTNC